MKINKSHDVMLTLFVIFGALAATYVLTLMYMGGQNFPLWLSILCAVGTVIGAWIAFVLALFIPTLIFVLIKNRYDDWYFRVGFKRWLEKQQRKEAERQQREEERRKRAFLNKWAR